MDPISFASQDHFEAEKERFSSFKFGKERPSSTSTSPSRTRHGRSHSRNLSVSSTVSSSFSFPATTSSIDLSTSPSSPVRSSVSSASKRHSHHRRQSSVSTRRESADVMGVAVPDLPPARSEENVNLGDRDSIRRRALLALEGKSELGVFSSMEIPELKTPEIEKSAFSFPAKPTFPTASGNAFGIGSLTNKRDSFGKSLLSSSSLKEQLGTLLEEEEEEDEAECVSNDVQPTEATAAPLVPAPQETLLPVELPVFPAKTRPAKIRPLALCTTAATPATSITIETGLPSPAPSPSVRAPALKPLTLVHAPLSSSPDFRSQRRSSLGGASRSASYSGHGYTSKRAKRGSLGYKSGDSPPLVAGTLPTPEMTPVSERRMSYGSDGTRSTSSSSSSEPVQVLSALTQPLSAAEQHFLYKSHNALLARIEDLERTLSRRTLRDSRSTSSLSSRTSLSVSTPGSAGSLSIAGPNEDLVQIVADLTAERDELRTDADGWRRRVADGERQTDELRKKLDGERRDAWIARERLAQLDTQNTTLQHALDTARAEVANVSHERDEVKTERDNLALQLAQALVDLAASRADAEALRARVDTEVARRERAEYELESAGLMSTPTPNTFPTKAHGLGFSIDSQATEVDGREWEFNLKAVVEEDESGAELGEYKLERPSDDSFSSTDDDDDDDDELGAEHEQEHTVIVASRSPSPLSTDQARDKRYSLSRSWTFPTGKSSNGVKPKDAADRFFACLDDAEDSDASNYSTPFDALARTDERGRELFCAMADESLDDVMFCIPSNVGEVVPEVSSTVAEIHEDLEDFGGVEVEGGIRFVFGPPSSPPTKPVPAASMFFGDEEEEDDATFTFPQSRLVTSPPTLPATSPAAAPARPTPVRPTFIPQPKAASPARKKTSSIPLPSRRATSPSPLPSSRTCTVPPQNTSSSSSSSKISSPSGPTTNTRLPVYRAAGRRL